MKHQGFLEYQRFRYLRIALWLGTLASAGYAWHRVFVFRAPGGVGYGGTWPGYALGTIAALLMLWLAWLGIRKRQYQRATHTKAWLSAHVYLGCLVVLLATLHSGFELGWNLHALLYLLMWIVVGSGVYGVVVFSRVPQRLTDAMGDETISTLMLQLSDADAAAQRLALTLPDSYNTLVADAATQTRLRDNVVTYLTGTLARNCATGRAVNGVAALNSNLDAGQARNGRELYAQLVRRQSLVERIRHAQRLMVQMRFWLVLHIPMALALLVALVAHIVSVFIYW